MAVIPRRRVALRSTTTLDAATLTAIRKAFRTGDEAALENAINTAGPDEVGEETQPEMGTAEGGSPHHVTVNIHSPGTAAAAAGAANPAAAATGVVTPDAGAAAGAAPAAAAAPDAATPAWAVPLIARLTALEACVASMKDGSGSDAPDPNAAGTQPTADEDPELGTGGPTVEKPDTLTTDSASTRALFQDTMAQAELLAPGVKLLTMDAKRTVKQTMDDLCAFRRRVLATATADSAMNTKIAPLVDGKDFKRMTCDAVLNTFTAASTLVKALNSNKTIPGFMPRSQVGAGKNGVMTVAEINAANRKLYGYA